MSIAPSSTLPKVSVIIPHFNQWTTLRACLDSVLSQNYPREKLEIILIDNNSDGDLSRIVDDYPDVLIEIEKRQGAAHARNRGMVLASGEVFAFTDADCIADENWIREGVRLLENFDVSGGEVTVTMTEQPSGVELFEKIFAFRQQRYIIRKQFSVTANLVVKRSVAEQTGWFVNDVSEDLDWCHRAFALGFRLAFNDKSIIKHPARREWAELTRKWRRLIEERRNGLKGHVLGQKLYWLGLAGVTAVSFIPHGWQILFGDTLDDYRSKCKALAVLTKIRLWRARHMMSVL